MKSNLFIVCLSVLVLLLANTIYGQEYTTPAPEPTKAPAGGAKTIESTSYTYGSLTSGAISGSASGTPSTTAPVTTIPSQTDLYPSILTPAYTNTASTAQPPPPPPPTSSAKASAATHKADFMGNGILAFAVSIVSLTIFLY